MTTYRCPGCNQITTTALNNVEVTHRCPARKHKDTRFVKEEEVPRV